MGRPRTGNRRGRSLLNLRSHRDRHMVAAEMAFEVLGQGKRRAAKLAAAFAGGDLAADPGGELAKEAAVFLAQFNWNRRGSCGGFASLGETIRKLARLDNPSRKAKARLANQPPEYDPPDGVWLIYMATAWIAALPPNENESLVAQLCIRAGESSFACERLIPLSRAIRSALVQTAEKPAEESGFVPST